MQRIQNFCRTHSTWGRSTNYLLSPEFHSVCLKVRLFLQMKAWTGNEDYSALDLVGACQDAAYLISNHLRSKDIQADLVQGCFQNYDNWHMWSESRNGNWTYVIDATATQFGVHFPPVVLATKKSLRSYYLQGEIMDKKRVDSLLGLDSKELDEIFRAL